LEEETEVEVVTARAAAEHRAAQYKEERFSWASLSWGHLRWATLAAGIAVAVFVARPALERMGRPHPAVHSAANQVSPPAAQPLSTTQVASAALPANSVPAVSDKDAAKRPAKRLDSTAGIVESTDSGVDANSVFPARPPRTPPAPQSEMHLAGNMGVVNGIPKQITGSLKKDAGSAGTSTVEAPSEEPRLMARADGPTIQNAPAIEKAKPALDEAVTRDAAVNESQNNESQSNGSQKSSTRDALAPSAYANLQAEVTPKAKTGNLAMKAAAPSAMQKPSASWMIADGVLQRSLDGGHTWQTAAGADYALLCYANRGLEVWAGGKAGTLLHSADGGATWRALAVSVNGQTLSSDVTHIDVRGPAEIVLSTGSHETWSSSDGGKTWAKK
jgi:hypothetical protein